jgi:hypothetical protein
LLVVIVCLELAEFVGLELDRLLVLLEIRTAYVARANIANAVKVDKIFIFYLEIKYMI